MKDFLEVEEEFLFNTKTEDELKEIFFNYARQYLPDQEIPVELKKYNLSIDFSELQNLDITEKIAKIQVELENMKKKIDELPEYDISQEYKEEIKNLVFFVRKSKKSKNIKRIEEEIKEIINN